MGSGPKVTSGKILVPPGTIAAPVSTGDAVARAPGLTDAGPSRPASRRATPDRVMRSNAGAAGAGPTQPVPSARLFEASTTTYATPIADLSLLGTDLGIFGKPTPLIDWERDLTAATRAKPVLSSRPLEEGEYRPCPRVPEFPKASQEKLRASVELVVRQLLSPQTTDDALSPFATRVRTAVGRAQRSLLRAVGRGPSERSKDDAFADEVHAAMDGREAYEAHVGRLFGHRPVTDTPLWHELEELGRMSPNPVPFASRLTAAMVAHSAFDGDGAKAAVAMRTLRERGIRIEDLPRTREAPASAADEAWMQSPFDEKQAVTLAADLAAALHGVGGEGVSVFKTLTRSRTTLDDPEEARAAERYLTVALQTQHVLTRHPDPGPVDRGGLIEMHEFASRYLPEEAGPPPPLRLSGSVQATHRDRERFAREVSDAVRRVAAGSADAADKHLVYAWHCGDRSREEMKQTESLVETMFVDWLMRAKERPAHKLAPFAPLKPILAVARASAKFMLDGAAAAQAVDSPLAMLETVGGQDIHIDWPENEQRRYNGKIQEAAETLLDRLRAALAPGVASTNPEFLRLKFAERRLVEALARGRTDEAVEGPDAPGPDGKPRLDLVGFTDEMAANAAAAVGSGLEGRPGREGWNYFGSPSAQTELRTLSGYGLPDLMAETLKTLGRMEDGEPPRLSSSGGSALAAERLRDAEAIRGSDPIKAKSGEIEDVIEALRKIIDAVRLGNRELLEKADTAGLNRLSVYAVGEATPLSGGPVVTANVKAAGRFAITSSGVAMELAGHVDLRGEIALGAGVAVNPLEWTPAAKYLSLALGGRVEGSMSFEKAIGVGVRGLRNVDEDGVAYRVFRKGNGAGRVPGSIYVPREGDGVAEADWQDESRYNMERFLDELESFAVGRRDDVAGSSDEGATLYRHMADKFLHDGRVVVVGQRQSASSREVTGVGSVTVAGRTPGNDKLGVGLTASAGASLRSGSINRSDRRSQSARGIVQSQDDGSLRGSAGSALAPPGAPVEGDPPVSGLGFPALFLGVTRLSGNRGIGISPRYHLKDGEVDRFSTTLDFVFRRIQEGVGAINEDLDGWRSLLGDANFENDIRELGQDSGADKLFALRLHGTRALTQRLNAYVAIQGIINEYTKAGKVHSGALKAESVINSGIDLMCDPMNYRHQGMFLFRLSLRAPGYGIKAGIQATAGDSASSEQERGFRGIGHGPAVALGDQPLDGQPLEASAPRIEGADRRAAVAGPSASQAAPALEAAGGAVDVGAA